MPQCVGHTLRRWVLPVVDIVGLRALSDAPFVTRWVPIVMCDGNIAVRTKLVRNQDTAAVCVSEAVSYEVLRLVGLPVAQCHAVTIGAEFAQDITRQYSFDPAVMSGRHWGTTLLTEDAIEVEFSTDDVARLRTPMQVLTLFVTDVLLANADRRTYGNVLLQGIGKNQFVLVPIDQSDCFDHPSGLRSPDHLTAVRGNKLAAWLPGLEDIVIKAAPETVRTEVHRIQALTEPILLAVNHCPDEWYDRAGVDPSAVRDFLAWRLANLETLVDIPYWDGLGNAIAGGYVLNI